MRLAGDVIRWLRASPGRADAALAVALTIPARPDYLVLVYGAGRATPGESLKNFPPTFLISAAADTGGLPRFIAWTRR